MPNSFLPVLFASARISWRPYVSGVVKPLCDIVLNNLDECGILTNQQIEALTNTTERTDISDQTWDIHCGRTCSEGMSREFQELVRTISAQTMRIVILKGKRSGERDFVVCAYNA